MLIKRQRDDGWAVEYEVQDEDVGLLDVRSVVAGSVDTATDYGDLLASLIVGAALRGLRVRTTSVDEQSKLIRVVIERP